MADEKEIEYNRESAKFEILVQSDTKNTLVAFSFPDGEVKEILVPHFNPKDQTEIVEGLKNRWVSELRAIDAEKRVDKVDVGKVSADEAINL